jgi:hypothetical protein
VGADISREGPFLKQEVCTRTYIHREREKERERERERERDILSKKKMVTKGGD